MPNARANHKRESQIIKREGAKNLLYLPNMHLIQPCQSLLPGILHYSFLGSCTFALYPCLWCARKVRPSSWQWISCLFWLLSLNSILNWAQRMAADNIGRYNWIHTSESRDQAFDDCTRIHSTLTIVLVLVRPRPQSLEHIDASQVYPNKSPRLHC